eukprot:2323683-Pyramimonas_sp.AAC.1
MEDWSFPKYDFRLSAAHNLFHRLQSARRLESRPFPKSGFRLRLPQDSRPETPHCVSATRMYGDFFSR